MYPVIGIPCRADYRTGSGQLIYGNVCTYVHAVESAGGLPILIPALTHLPDLENLLPCLDGLLFPGGVDIQPDFYGEKDHPSLYAVNPQLDTFEVALATWALQRDMPILGICRGMHLINVLLGGTLYQDLAAQYSGSLQHCRLDLPRTELMHQVTVEQGSLMNKILKTHQLSVNSLHHQAVKDPGKSVHICGWADDGVAELLEVSSHRFVLGVQCHPEDIYQDIPAFAHLFRAFIDKCSQPPIELTTPAMPVQTLRILQAV